MIEIIALCLLALAFTSLFWSSCPLSKMANLQIPEDSLLRRHFLTQLRFQDPSLAAKIEKRLAKLG